MPTTINTTTQNTCETRYVKFGTIWTNTSDLPPTTFTHCSHASRTSIDAPSNSRRRDCQKMVASPCTCHACRYCANACMNVKPPLLRQSNLFSKLASCFFTASKSAYAARCWWPETICDAWNHNVNPHLRPQTHSNVGRRVVLLACSCSEQISKHFRTTSTRGTSNILGICVRIFLKLAECLHIFSTGLFMIR